MKYALQDALSRLLPQLGFPLSAPLVLDIPTHTEFGHYALTVAFGLAKALRKSPKLIAEDLAAALSEQPQWQTKLSFTAVNGYVNIKVEDGYLWELVMNLNPAVFAVQDYTPDQTPVLLEYVSANPTGPLHIGHGRWAVLGDVLSRLLRFTGHNVSTEFYINDAGSQIQKLRDRVAAVKKGQPVPEDGYHGQYIYDLAASDKDPVELNLTHQKQILEKCGVAFDTWFSEKTLYKEALIDDVIMALRNKGLTYVSEDALWFKSTDFGDDKDRVLIKSDGAYTYFLADLAYHMSKVSRGFKRLINIWGADHHGYVMRVKAGVIALCGDDFRNDNGFKVMIGQLVNLYRDGVQVRMSKRTGEMITLEDVLEEIGSDSVRYFLAEKSPDTHVDFDLTLAVKQSSENPVFYCQYAHARFHQLLEKIKVELGKTPVSNPALTVQLNDSEKELLSHLMAFNDELWDASRLLSPHKVVQYTWELARKIQFFYEHSPLLKADEVTLVQRLAIVEKSKMVLKQLLDLLGLSAPEKM